MTLNELQCFIDLGHREGRHALGQKWDWQELRRAGHHDLLAHGKAIQAIRACNGARPRAAPRAVQAE